MILSIFRPTIVRHERHGRDDVWLEVSRTTLTLWEPMPDETVMIKRSGRPDELRIVIGGGSLACKLDACDGQFFAGKNGQTYLRTILKSALTPDEALARARSDSCPDVLLIGLDPETAEPLRPFDPFAGVSTRLARETTDSAPPPKLAKTRKPAPRLTLFGEED